MGELGEFYDNIIQVKQIGWLDQVYKHCNKDEYDFRLRFAAV